MPKQIATYTPEYAMTRLMDAISLVETEKEGWNTLRSCAKDLYQSVTGSQMSDHSLARLLRAEKPNNSPDAINVHALMFPAPEMTIEEWINQPAPEGVVSISDMYQEAESILRRGKEKKTVMINTTKDHLAIPTCDLGSTHCKNTECKDCKMWESRKTTNVSLYDDTDSYPHPFYTDEKGVRYLIPSMPGRLDHSNTNPSHRDADGYSDFWLFDQHFHVYVHPTWDIYIECYKAIPISLFGNDKFYVSKKDFYYSVQRDNDLPSVYKLQFPMEWIAAARFRVIRAEDTNHRYQYKFLGKHPDSNKRVNSLK